MLQAWERESTQDKDQTGVGGVGGGVNGASAQAQAPGTSEPSEYASASRQLNPDVRLSPGSPYSTSPVSDDESSREKAILSDIKSLEESSLISSHTENEESDKKVISGAPSIISQGILLEPFYDHSPGEVYTIPEEEDEISSPTSGDGVTSLRKRRLVGGNLTFHSQIQDTRYVTDQIPRYTTDIIIANTTV